jgi:hypothetical protein
MIHMESGLSVPDEIDLLKSELAEAYRCIRDLSVMETIHGVQHTKIVHAETIQKAQEQK